MTLRISGQTQIRNNEKCCATVQHFFELASPPLWYNAILDINEKEDI